MGKLNDIGLKYKTDKASDNHNFLDFYEEQLPKNPKRLLEMGTYEGASLKMWRAYYPNCDIVGVDIREPSVIDGVIEYQINSRDVYALKKLGKFDIIIDDGSHMQLDQQVFMQFALDNMLTKNGVFVMEDVHCSFWEIMQDGSKQNTEDVLNDLEADYNITYFIHENKLQNYTAVIKKK